MNPWIDRNILISQVKGFVKSHNSFFKSNANRIGSLVEITVYNSIVSLYEKLGFKLEAKNLGPKKSFRYKLSSTGLMNNFSYFEATSQERKEIIWILHNTKIQSAHNDHLYYAPDIVVCLKEGAITRKLKSKREHSFVENEYLLTFVEVKHLVPFPEILFSFTGLVLEFQPTFITKPSELKKAGGLHLAPMIVFTGNSSEFADKIKEDLIARYGINIVYGTQKHGGQIADFSKLNKYNKS